MKESCVYSFWDDSKICIYVGVTQHIETRFQTHIEQSSFAWEIFDFAVIEKDLDRDSAMQLETEYVQKWNPRYNDRKSIWSEIVHPKITSDEASEVLIYRQRWHFLGADQDLPAIIANHPQRLEQWLDANPEVSIEEWPGATGVGWSKLLQLFRCQYLQQSRGAA